MILKPKDRWALVPKEQVLRLFVRVQEGGVDLKEAASDLGLTQGHLELILKGQLPMKAWTRYLLELILAHPEHRPKNWPPRPMNVKVTAEAQDWDDEF